MPTIQGIINETKSAIPMKTMKSVIGSFQDFWRTDGKLTESTLLTHYGPIGAVGIFFVILSVLSLFLVCLQCTLIRWFLMIICVYVLTLVLLYKKYKQYCPNRKPVEDLTILSIWPTLCFMGGFLLPKIIAVIIPGIGLLFSVPLLSDVVSIAIACLVYMIALPYSQYLLVKRACEQQNIVNVWTFGT